MMKLIRLVLGAIILFFDRVFTPTSMSRTPEAQAQADLRVKSLVLYQLNACPFCVKVRRELKRLGISVALKDIGKDPQAHQELMAGGKEDQAPCLKITKPDQSVQWLYESTDIVNYLRAEFA